MASANWHFCIRTYSRNISGYRPFDWAVLFWTEEALCCTKRCCWLLVGYLHVGQQRRKPSLPVNVLSAYLLGGFWLFAKAKTKETGANMPLGCRGTGELSLKTLIERSDGEIFSTCCCAGF